MAEAIQKYEDQTPSVAPMVAMIERIAMNPDLPIDRLEQMLAMKERMDAQAAEQAFNAAFAAAAAEIPAIPLNGKGHNGRPYATLKDIVAKTRPVLAQHGLSLSWDVSTDDGKVRIVATLSHTQGHTRRSEIVLPADTSGSKNPVQAIGSTQTYGQRYTAQAILGLSLGDDTEDDGAGGSAPATITEEQVSELRNLCQRGKVSEDLVCQSERVGTLADLPAKRFATVRDNLMVNVRRVEGDK